MCYSHDEYATVWREEWRRARKQHNCDGCGKIIEPGDQHVYVFSITRGYGAYTSRECETCRYHRAFIYAEERSEGCHEGESWYPLEVFHDEMSDRGWFVPGVCGHREDEDRTVVRFGAWREPREALGC